MGVNIIMADITGMEAIGRVLPIYQGEYNNSKAYEETDIVLYNNSSYIALQNTAGNPPPESDNSNEYWQLIAKGIIANISDTTVKFEQAKIRENIQSDEDVKTLFGKIKKWFAEDKATKDGNGSNIAETYAEKTLVGAERTGLETNIQYSYPSTVTGEKKVITNVKSLKLAIENSTNNLTRAILHFKDTAGTKTYWNLTEINSTLSWETATITDIYRSMREETIACMEFPTRCPVANEMDFANSGTIMIFKTNSEFRVPTPIGFAAQAYHPEDTYIINTKSTNGEVSIKVEKVFTKSSILNSTAITKQGEYALDAIEKNAAIEGTLANLINSLNSNMAAASMSNTIYASADIEHNAYHTLCSFTVPAGMNIVIVSASFTQNNIGYRRIGLSYDGHSFHMNRIAMKTEQSVSDNATVVLLWYVHDTKVENTLYLMAQQNSGITLNCWYGIRVLTFDNAKFYTMPYEIITPDSNV